MASKTEERDIKKEADFLMSIYPEMFERKVVENLLDQMDYDSVRKKLDDFSFAPTAG